MTTAYGDSTRKVKSPTTPIRLGGNSDTEINLHFGCGEIPLEGRFNQRIWSNRFLGVSEKIFKTYVRDFGIPHKRCGNDIYVDARDFWDSLPSVTFTEE